MGIGTYLPLWAVGKRKLAHIHQSLQQYLEHNEPTIKISHKYYLLSEVLLSGLPRWLSGKESACQCRRLEFYPWVRKIPWRRDWQLLPGECYGQRSLVGYSPWVQKELDTTQQINDRGPALTSNSYVKMETRVLSFHLVPQFKSSVGSYLTGKELKPSAMKWVGQGHTAIRKQSGLRTPVHFPQACSHQLGNPTRSFGHLQRALEEQSRLSTKSPGPFIENAYSWGPPGCRIQ